MNFANLDLSAFYLDVAKDRLYISSCDAWRRRSCQTVLAAVLEQLAAAMGPLVPHLAEEAFQSIPYRSSSSSKSVFQKGWPAVSYDYKRDSSNVEGGGSKVVFELLQKSIRGDVNKVIEGLRQAKEIGASMECRVFLFSEDPWLRGELLKLLPEGDKNNGVDDLRYLLMVSQVDVVDSIEQLLEECPQYHLINNNSVSKSGGGGLSVGVRKAAGQKCERCWYFCESVGQDVQYEELCLRCADVIRKDGYVMDA